MSANTSKVLFFTAEAKASAAEIAAIQRLEQSFRNVKVRNGAETAANQRFSGGLESFDFLAGTVPSAYSTGNEALVLTVPSDVNPDQFKVFPATLSLDASNADVTQLSAIKTVVTNGLAVLTDLAAHASVTWSSENEAVATVGADGLVTAVGAGGPINITATLQAGTSVTGGAIEADNNVYTKSAHGFLTGEQVRLVSLTGGTGVTAGEDYYFHKLSADTGYLCATLDDAANGVAVDVTVDATSVVLVQTPVTSSCALTVAA